MIKVISVVGARPNFMKVAPLHRAMVEHGGFQSMIVHTGQHYDAKMSDVFFEQLEMPRPDVYLGIGGGSHAVQTAKVMIAFEEIVIQEKPDYILVVGDVNSTLAASIVAAKCHIPVIHVEAGLRSFDREMPEEINRIVTDSISSLLFVTEDSGVQNLMQEGVSHEKVHMVGNVMIDSLIHFREKSKASSILSDLGLSPKDYILVTMHRPANVDTHEGLQEILHVLEKCSKFKDVVFAVHPRTLHNFDRFGLISPLKQIQNLHLIEPLGYLEFLNLMENAMALVTDSGGVQEETTFLGVPCLTLRDSTERPVTVDLGTNQLLPLSAHVVGEKLQEVIDGNAKKGTIPPLWDGKTAQRIVRIIDSFHHPN